MVKNQKAFALYIIVAIAAVVLLNVVGQSLFFRVDLTASQIYSLSPSSKAVLNKMDDLVTAKVYFSEDLPGRYGNNGRFLQDILEEYAAYSGGNLKFEFYQPDDDEKLAEEAVKYGIQPVQLQVVENDKLEIKRVHMGLVFLYEDQREVIPVVQTTTGLEYEITSKIKKLVDDQKQVIGFAQFAGLETKTQNVQLQLGESYRVHPVPMAEVVPANVNLLFVSGVTDSVSEGELQNLRDYIDRGGNLFLAQSKIDASLQTQRGTPIASNSSFIQPTPMPRRVRPFERWSRVALCFAATTGLCWGTMRMPVPKLMLDVTPAMYDIQISGSGMSRSSWPPAILPLAWYGYCD